MTAGIPGAGIGGLFYLVGALAAPLREAVRALRGHPLPRQWPLVSRQFLLANVILGSLATTGWLLASLAELAGTQVMRVGNYPVASGYTQVMAWNTGVATLAVLIVVLVSVEVLRFAVRITGRMQRVAVFTLIACALAGEASGQERDVHADTRSDTATEKSEQRATAGPGEVETWRQLGIAHERAGRFGQASAAFSQALALAPDDEILVRQLESVRVRVAPALEVGTTITRETGASAFGPSVAADFAVGASSRLVVFYLPRRVGSEDDATRTQRFGARLNVRPRAGMRLDLAGTMWSSESAELATEVRPELSFRLRNSAGANGPVVDVRGHHQIVDVTPDLVRAPLASTQVSGRIDVPFAGPIRLRGNARIASLSQNRETTRRTGVGGGLAVAVKSDIRVTGQWHVTRHSNPLVTGYFAPSKAHGAELGLELEREYDRATISFDLGGGMQRVQNADMAIARWAPALRGWGLLAWTVTPRQHLLVEFEAYDSRIPLTISATERWRYVSMTTSWRVVLPS
jgi:hypothetical protein